MGVYFNRVEDAPELTDEEVLEQIDLGLADEGIVDSAVITFIKVVAQLESNLDPYAINPTSTGVGLYMLKNSQASVYYAQDPSIGLPTIDNRTDARLATRAMARFYVDYFEPLWDGADFDSSPMRIDGRRVKNTAWSAKYPEINFGEFCYGLIWHDGIDNAVNGLDRGGVVLWRNTAPQEIAPIITLLSQTYPGEPITINWTAATLSNEVDFYDIYNSTLSGEDFEFNYVDTVDGDVLTYEDTTDYGSDQTLYYIIEAYSDLPPFPYIDSEEDSIAYEILQFTAPIITVDQVGDGDPIDISWTAATTNAGSITDYELYRQVNGSGFGLFQTLGSGTLSYEDNSSYSDGDELDYYVIANATTTSGQSNTDSVTYADVPMAAPHITITAAHANNGSIDLNGWCEGAVISGIATTGSLDENTTSFADVREMHVATGGFGQRLFFSFFHVSPQSQTVFTSIEIPELGVTFNTASATSYSPLSFGGGYLNRWTWSTGVNMSAGNTYTGNIT